MDYWRKIDLNLLLVFEAIYLKGNISRAAHSLGITQPTASNALRRLRESLGDQLFVRSHNGVTPTPKAIRMIGPVRQSLAILRDGIELWNNSSSDVPAPHFQLGVTRGSEAVLADPITRMIGPFSDMRIETRQLNHPELLTELLNGTLDAAISTKSNHCDFLECRKFGTAHDVLIATRMHPAISGVVSLDQLSTLRYAAWAREQASFLDEVLNSRNLSRNVVYWASELAVLPALVASTDLVSVVPSQLAADAARWYPISIHTLPIQPQERNWYLHWSKKKATEPILHRFMAEFAKSRASVRVK